MSEANAAGPSLPLPDFQRLSVAVVGDLIADHAIVSEPRGLSREAPVMVLRHVTESIGAGGAANVARNLRALGARTRILGAVGRDARGRELLQILCDEDIDASGVVTVPGWTTPTKTRVFAAEPRRSRQQVLRIDREPDAPVGDVLRRGLQDDVRALAGEVDVVLVSDYEYGAVDHGLAAAARELEARGTPVVLDPRREVERFHGVTALTPNVGELARFVGVDVRALDGDEAVLAAGRELHERLALRWLLVTRGNRGMALFGPNPGERARTVPASGQDDVTDVSGAGDTAAAVFALALAAGQGGDAAMTLANAASGVVVMKSGAATCSPAELRSVAPACPRPARVEVG